MSTAPSWPIVVPSCSIHQNPQHHNRHPPATSWEHNLWTLAFTEQLTHPFWINQTISATAHAKTSLRNFNMATQRARLSLQKVGSYICLYYITSNWELEERPLRQGELFLSFNLLAGTWDTNEIHPEFWLSLWKGLETAMLYANTSWYLFGHPHLDIPTPAVHGQIDEIKAWSQGGCLEGEGFSSTWFFS